MAIPGYGAQKYKDITIASGSTFSSIIDLGHVWANVAIKIPTMASGSDMFIKGCACASNLVRVRHNPYTGTDTPAEMSFDSSITNCMVGLTNYNYRYIQVELGTATTDSAYTFRVVYS